MTKFHIFVRFISLTLYIRCMKVKLVVHTRIHCITSYTSQVFFYLIVFTICLWGEEADRKHFDLGRCSIHNAYIYIVYSPFGDSENREFFLFIKNLIYFFSFLYRYFILYTINYTNSSKYLQICWTQNKSYLLNSYIEKIFIT